MEYAAENEKRNGESWQSRAACRGHDPEIFFVDSRRSYKMIQQAKSICAGCPVRGECLEAALVNNEEYGIWGGQTESERHAITRRVARYNLSNAAIARTLAHQKQPDL